VLVIRTGTANTASVLAGLARCGATPRLSQDPGEAYGAARVVLPGVGTFGAARGELALRELLEPLRRRIGEGRPTLAICLGMQLLAEGSEENPAIPGLGIVAGLACRYPASVRVPQLGWNRVEPDPGCRLLEPGFAYFANSYRLVEQPPGWASAWADHGGRFLAALERGAVLGCQFHPELSGAWGLSLLRRWLRAAEGGSPC